MALIQKDNPVGIDCTIARIQEYIWNNVSWNTTPFTADSYNSYERAYKNESNTTLRWEVFINNGGVDYKDVLYNDNYLATSFFIVSDTVTANQSRESTDVSIIFQISVKQLYTTVQHRADEEAHREIATLIKKSQWARHYTGMIKGIRNVYQEIGYGQREFEDMQDKHVFRVNFSNIEIC